MQGIGDRKITEEAQKHCLKYCFRQRHAQYDLSALEGPRIFEAL